MSDWELRGGKDIKRVAAELRKMDDKEILKRFRKELRAAAAPMVPAVRQSIANIPVKGDVSAKDSATGLRKRLQKATRLMLRTGGKLAGIRVLVDPKKLPDHERSLPAMEEGLKPWKHPVYGDRGVWVRQEPHPYFFKVVRKLGPASRIAVNRVIDGITKSIT